MTTNGLSDLGKRLRILDRGEKNLRKRGHEVSIEKAGIEKTEGRDRDSKLQSIEFREEAIAWTIYRVGVERGELTEMYPIKSRIANMVNYFWRALGYS